MGDNIFMAFVSILAGCLISLVAATVAIVVCTLCGIPLS